MKPARFVGRRYLVEEEPFDIGIMLWFHGVDPETLERVVVAERNQYLSDDEKSLFPRAGTLLASLGQVAPRLLHVLGRNREPYAYVLEDVEGLTLAAMLTVLRERGEFLPVDIAQAIVRELVDLVRAPVPLRVGIGEVLITPDGRVRAKPKLEELEARQTVGAAVLVIQPQVSYLSPESVRGFDRTFASEMFTLGVILYELIANRHPFVAPNHDNTMFEILTRIQRALPPPLEAFRADVPPEVTAFIDRAMAPEPTHRFKTWDEFLAGLPSRTPDQILAAMPIPPEREPPLVIGPWDQITADDLVPQAQPMVLSRLPDPLPPMPALVVQPGVHYGRDRRPMLEAGSFYVDMAPVSRAEYQRFILATRGRAALDPTADWSFQTNVSLVDAAGYAQWAGKRLPTDAEWSSAMLQHSARIYDPYRAVWEWMATRSTDGGYVVRGGRWRNVPDRIPQFGNRSHETDPAPDVGFRCVQDV
ncbi:MAG: SUMF1/EgtB/PvdO family nonheme iron enzyme [Kofleriaceae bacterium]